MTFQLLILPRKFEEEDQLINFKGFIECLVNLLRIRERQRQKGLFNLSR